MSPRTASVQSKRCSQKCLSGCSTPSMLSLFRSTLTRLSRDWHTVFVTQAAAGRFRRIAETVSTGGERADDPVHDCAGVPAGLVAVFGAGDVKGGFTHSAQHGQGGRLDRLGRNAADLGLLVNSELW